VSIEDKELVRLINRCQRGDRKSQNELHQKFYGFAMGVVIRYTHTREEAIEIVNDGFLKVLTRLNKYSRQLSFWGWVRKIMVNTAIDAYRKTAKDPPFVELSYAKDEGFNPSILEQISEQELIAAIQQLPPSYRVVFNLYVIEGYKHHEIAGELGISEGTSKSNLAVAKSKLKKHLKTLPPSLLRISHPSSTAPKINMGSSSKSASPLT